MFCAQIISNQSSSVMLGISTLAVEFQSVYPAFPKLNLRGFPVSHLCILLGFPLLYGSTTLNYHFNTFLY